MQATAAAAVDLPDTPATIPAPFGALLASLFSAILAILLAKEWPTPIHRVSYWMVQDPPPAPGPGRYRHLWIAPDKTIRFEGREVTATALVQAVGIADAADPRAGYFLGVHPEARWEDVLETLTLLRRNTMSDIRLPHAHPYDLDRPAPIRPVRAQSSTRSSSR